MVTAPRGITGASKHSIQGTSDIDRVLRKGFDPAIHRSALKAFGQDQQLTLGFMQVMERFAVLHFRLLKERLLGQASAKRYRNILDVGCGPATLSKLLIDGDYAEAADLVDFDAVLEVAFKHFIPKPLRKKMLAAGNDVKALPESGRYSLVILSNILHEFWRAEAAALMGRTCNAIGRDGEIWVLGLLGNSENPALDRLSYYTRLHDDRPIHVIAGLDRA